MRKKKKKCEKKLFYVYKKDEKHDLIEKCLKKKTLLYCKKR